RQVRPPNHPAYRFDPETDLVLDRRTPLPGHANGMAFHALDADGNMLLRREYFSIGGGFVVSGDELRNLGKAPAEAATRNIPYPFRLASEMLEMAAGSGLSIAAMKRANEEMHMS